MGKHQSVRNPYVQGSDMTAFFIFKFYLIARIVVTFNYKRNSLEQKFPNYGEY